MSDEKLPELILFYNGPFSQWWSSLFCATTLFPANKEYAEHVILNKEQQFLSCEQYMMFEKAMLFRDYQSAYLIITSLSPKTAKAIGRQVNGFDETIWKNYREDIVFIGNYYKFTQNSDLKQYLANSGNKIFVEASPYDQIWGIGLNKNDPAAKNPKTWKGLNLLGKAITKVRDKLFPSNLEEKIK